MEEVFVVLVYNGILYVVMMVLFKDFEYFVFGFLFFEGIIESLCDIFGMDVVFFCNGFEV